MLKLPKSRAKPCGEKEHMFGIPYEKLNQALSDFWRRVKNSILNWIFKPSLYRNLKNKESGLIDPKTCHKQVVLAWLDTSSENFQELCSCTPQGCSQCIQCIQLHFHCANARCSLTINHSNSILNAKIDVRQSSWINSCLRNSWNLVNITKRRAHNSIFFGRGVVCSPKGFWQRALLFEVKSAL